ncbi:hypothetical protein L1887_42152 [Cichorium endivia]|nr:hypothetical protein L1887_42152 [Cichorium endivia]
MVSATCVCACSDHSTRDDVRARVISDFCCIATSHHYQGLPEAAAMAERAAGASGGQGCLLKSDFVDLEASNNSNFTYIDKNFKVCGFGP